MLEKILVSQSARPVITNVIFLSLLLLAAPLSILDGNNFVFVNIARALLYLSIIILIILNLSNRHVIKTVLILAACILLELWVSFFLQPINHSLLLKFIAMLAAVGVFPIIEVKGRVRRIARLVCVILLIYLLFSSFFLYASYFFGASSVGWLPEINPNSAAAISLVLFILFSRLRESHSAIPLVMTIVTVITISNYQSRTVLFAMAIYIILVLFKDIKFNKKLSGFIYIIAMILSLTLPFLYVSMSQTYMDGYDAKEGGKMIFSGRQDIWSEVIDNINSDVIVTGLGKSGIDEQLDAKGFHNAYIATYYHFGILALLFFIAMMYRVVSAGCNVYMYAILAVVLIVNCFETTFVEGDYIAVLMYLLFINYEGGRK